MPKPTLVLDLDGVIATATPGEVYNEKAGWAYERCHLVKGALDGVKALAKHYRLVLSTARREEDYDKTVDWLHRMGLLSYFDQVQVGEKPAAVAYVDDRAVKFRDWPGLLRTLLPGGEPACNLADKEPGKRLMFVAHPDDEVLNAFKELKYREYTVVCMTCSDESRRIEFSQAMDALGVRNRFLLSYSDCGDWSDRDEHFIEEDLKSFLDALQPEMVVTHNAVGEYGHPHHIVLHRLLDKLVPMDFYEFSQDPNTLNFRELAEKVQVLGLYSSQWGHFNGMSSIIGRDGIRRVK